MNLDNRGIFTIPIHFVSDEPDSVAKILSNVQFVPLRVETFLMYNYVKYEGLSPLFDPIEMGTETPEYDLIMSSGPKGELINVHFEAKA